jgi:hypothetical protein
MFEGFPKSARILPIVCIVKVYWPQKILGRVAVHKSLKTPGLGSATRRVEKKPHLTSYTNRKIEAIKPAVSP